MDCNLYINIKLLTVIIGRLRYQVYVQMTSHFGYVVPIIAVLVVYSLYHIPLVERPNSLGRIFRILPW